MKVFGHPIHLMLIHFPSALFPTDLVCSFIYAYSGDETFYFASFYVMTGGVLTGWISAISGMLDLGGVAKNKPSSLRKALIHGAINGVVLIVYTLVALYTYKHLPAYIPGLIIITILKLILVLLMVVANFMGADLVLKDSVLEK